MEADASAIDHVRHSARAEAYGPAYARRPPRPLTDVLVADHDGVVIGVAALNGTQLSSLYVLPGAQGLGAGAQLLEAATDAGARELWVFADNMGARRFYERHGWVAEPETEMTGEQWQPRKPGLRYRRL